MKKHWHFSPKKVLKKAIRCSLVGVTIAGAVFSAHQGFSAAAIHNTNYKTTAQITEDGALFGNDLQIAKFQTFFSEFQRLKHNGDEPIYIHVGNSYNKTEKQVIEEIFDYYQSLFNTINPNYKFEFVDNLTLASKYAQGKTTINISKSAVSEADGACIRIPALLDPNFTSSAQILVHPRNYILENENSVDNDRVRNFYGVMFEEITHAFGFGDVYYDNKKPKIWEVGLNNTTNVIFENTVMNNTLSNSLVELYPQDLRILVALYGQTRDKDGNLLQNKVEEYENLIDRYSTHFYEVRKAEFEQVYNQKDPNNPITIDNINASELDGFAFEKEYVNMNFTAIKGATLPLGNHTLLTYKVALQGNQITFDVYDYMTKQKLDSATAPYKLIDGMIVVEELKLTKLPLSIGTDLTDLTKGGLISSFAIVKTNKGYEFINMKSINLSSTFSLENQNQRMQNYISLSSNAKFSTKKDLETFQNLKTDFEQKLQPIQEQMEQ